VSRTERGSEPLRVLHVVGRGMTRGGLQTWLMHVLRRIDRERVASDFLVGTDRPCAFDDEIRALGSEVIAGPFYRRLPAYVARLREVLREHGPYDVVHAHPDHVAGPILRAARQEGVPVRIAHSHNDRRADYAEAGLAKRFWVAWTRRMLLAHATHGLACSQMAAASLFGADWEADGRWRVLPYGIDLAPFAEPVDRAQLRAELGLGLEDFVVGHVGNFRPQKNHEFLVAIAAEALRRRPELCFLLIGREMEAETGLRARAEALAADAGITARFRVLGERADVPRLMLGAMDAFVLPSRWEGLGIVLLEAQAAGLPCVYSDVIAAEEVELVPELMHRRSPDQSAAAWAEALATLADSPPAVARAQALAAMRAGPANIERSAAELEAVYVG